MPLRTLKFRTSDRQQASGSKPISRSHHNGIYEAAAVGIAGSSPSLYYLSQIDENVLQAMDFAFAQDLSNFQTLHNYIEEKYMNVFDQESAVGWMSRLEGYVTEQYAADILEKLGHEVEWPSEPNQEGWDLLVDGEPWQIKGGIYAEKNILEHLEKNPDLPVITTPSAAEHFADHGQVLGLEGLDADRIYQATQHSVEGIDNLGDHMGMGIPIVTIAISSMKEIGLLMDGKTDIVNSAKHVALDTLGTGGGGLAGAKVGALIGSVGGPVGAAVGGLLGGIVGAIGGRSITESVKRSSFNQSLRDYQEQVQKSQKEIERINLLQRNQLVKYFQDQNQDMNLQQIRIKLEYSQKVASQKENLIQRQKKLVLATPQIISLIQAELQMEKQEKMMKLNISPFWKRWLLPTADDREYRLIKKDYRIKHRQLEKAKKRYSRSKVQTSPLNYYQDTLSFFRMIERENSLLAEHLKGLYEAGETFHSIRKRAKKDMFILIQEKEISIRKKVSTSFEKIVETVTKEKDLVKQKLTILKQEGSKLGIDL